MKNDDTLTRDDWEMLVELAKRGSRSLDLGGLRLGSAIKQAKQRRREHRAIDLLARHVRLAGEGG